MATRKQTTENSQRKITIIFGYSLFVMALVTVIVSTVIPWSILLLDSTVKHLNVIITLLSFIAAAIVPFLVAYIMGDKTTRTKNKVVHHYNGVLFGVVAYWLSLFFSSIGSSTVSPVRQAIPEFWMSTVVNSWPILANILVITIIAMSYHARPQKAGESVLQYRPYQVLLLSSVIATLALTQQYLADGYQLIGLLYIAISAIFIGISYMVLRKVHPFKLARLSSAIVAFSFGIITMGFAGQLASVIGYNILTTLAVTGISLVAWALYLWARRTLG
jgi:hypothetical protein